MKAARYVIALAPLLLIAVLLYRTATFGIEADTAAPGGPPDIRVDSKRVAAHLAGAIQLRTISYQDTTLFDPEPFRALHAYLARTFPLVSASLDRETVGGSSLLYTWRGPDPGPAPLLLMAHQDVVPADPATENEWTHPPFDGAITDGFIWGRGALDVKSGMMGMLEAVEYLLREGFRPRRTIYIALGHDEEIGGSRGAARVAALLRSRNVRLDFVLDEGGAILDGIIEGVGVPIALVGVAEKGYVSIELSVEGAGGHSSMPPRHTAVGRLSRAIAALEARPFPADLTYAARLSEYVARELPFHRRLLAGNLWLFRPIVVRSLGRDRETNALIRTTTAATMFRSGIKENVLPTEARAVVNFRILPGETVEGVVARVRRVIDDADVRVQVVGLAFDPPPTSDVTSASFALLRRTIEDVAGGGVIVAPYLTLGATDSRYFVGIADNVYRFFFNAMEREDVARVHGIDERISVVNYERLVRFYIQLMRNCQELS